MWATLEPLIAQRDPHQRRGRRRGDDRAMLEAILYRLITGRGWHQLPREFPHASSVYRAYRRWLASGLLEEIIRHILTYRTADQAPHDRSCPVAAVQEIARAAARRPQAAAEQRA